LSMKGEMPHGKKPKTAHKKSKAVFDRKEKPQNMNDALAALKGKFSQ